MATFSIDSYDRDGDAYEYGIYLHFGETRIRIAKDPDGYEKTIKELLGMTREIRESYPRELEKEVEQD